MKLEDEPSFPEFLWIQFIDAFAVYFFVILVICGFLQILVFPFYVYVNHKNRDKDREALVYPITRFLYQFMVFTFVMLVLEHINYIFWFYFTYRTYYGIPLPIFGIISIPKGFLFFGSVGVAFDVISVGINHIFQFVLSILALQKFILYFFENTRRYVELSQTKMKVMVYIIGFIVGSKQIALVVITISCNTRSKLCMTLQPITFLINESRYTFFSIYAFFIVTALLYLPMMYSLHKLRHLKSIKETQPQKYLLWQTIALLITKLVLIPIVIFYLYYIEFDTLEELFSDMWYFVKLDSFTTPLAMQVTYLGCNKKNLEMALSCFKRKVKIGAGVDPVGTESTISVQQINVVRMT